MSLGPLKPTGQPKPPESRALVRERKARKRAEELLENRSRELYESKKELEKAYLATVEVFASLLSDRRARSSEDLRRMATHAKLLGERAGFSQEQARVMHLATVLCDIGKLALPDILVDMPYVQLSREQVQLFQKHPQFAYQALMALPPLEAVATAILSHCERVDGSGYPNKVKGDAIPLESRVLAIVKDFDALKRGVIVKESLTEAESLRYLRTHAGERYDKALVAAFAKIIEEKEDNAEQLSEQRLTPSSLRPDMVVTRDMTNANGLLVIPAGQELNEKLIAKLRHMEDEHPGQILIYVRVQAEADPDEQVQETNGEAEPSVARS